MKIPIAFREYFLNSLWAGLSVILALTNLRAEVDVIVALFMTTHLSMAVLFLIRRAPTTGPSGKLSCIVAFASMLYGYLYKFDDVVPSTFGDAVVTTGAVLCLLSLLSLGDCFGVLPALRGVRTRGLYRLVRHPLYASYILTDLGLLMLYPRPWNYLLFIVAIGLFLSRIKYEEAILSQIDSYRHYMSAVPYRLFPLFY